MSAFSCPNRNSATAARACVALAQQVLDDARHLGATACETDVSEAFGQSVTVRRQEVETIEYNRDKGIGVTVYLGQRRGHASTSDFSADAVRATVEAALSIARFTAEDPCAGLPEASLLATPAQGDIDLDLFYPWHLPVEEAIDIAQRCEQAAFDVSPLITNSEGASVSVQQSHFISANSLGFMGGYATSRHYLSCSAIAGEGDDMQRDDWYSGQRDPRDLAAPEAIGDYAARRTLSRLGARKLKTRQVPVLFEAPLAAGLIGSFVHAVSGGSLYRKSSFLLDALGKRIFPDFVHIDERPHLQKGLASSPFDDDGVATRDRDVVDGRRAARLFPLHLLGAQAGHADHRQCRRQPQPAGRARPAAISPACCDKWAPACWSPNCSATASTT